MMVAQIPHDGAAGAGLTGLQPGRAYPPGARADGNGVNFALFSEHAEYIELCVFDAEGVHELARHRLPACTDRVWHGYLPGAGPGLVYGYRVHGPFDPARGLRFDPAKLLLDPWAREVVGAFRWGPEHFSAPAGDSVDNSRQALKARVCADRYDWAGDQPLRHALADSVFYETHVRGMTIAHPDVPEPLRGTFAGLASEPILRHLRQLGVTAVCLLPVQFAIDEQRLAAAGMRNYWGYNTLAYFVPDPRLASSGSGQAQRDEFRDMVCALHRAGIEVILDVVYNHTAESDERGPTLSFRGIDNPTWYRLLPGDHAGYDNVTGCGNTVQVVHPVVLQWLMDSLRYWVEEMHVDGFRFDLAVTLGRTRHGFDPDAAFFAALRQDPLLAGVKLISEPWDIGPGGYQAGAFPLGWSEWNGRFRDGIRAFWLRHGVTRGEFARRLCGSSEMFRAGGRQPQASINLLTAHDGFTLHDLVSYDVKHNLANGEDNRDGHDDNLSWNCGIEGPSTDPEILALRAALKRALLATLMLSQGVPQLLGGDELGRSQGGNNNAYCQDNSVNWFDWSLPEPGLVRFLGALAALRKGWPQLRQTRWLDGLPGADGRRDIRWFGSDGEELSPADWDDPVGRTLGCELAWPGDRDLLILVHGGPGSARFRLPAGTWTLMLDSHTGEVPCLASIERPAPGTGLPGIPLGEGGFRGSYPLTGPALVVFARG